MVQFGFEQLEQVLLVHTAAAAFGLQVDAVAYKREAEGVALTYQQLGEHGGSVAGECDFVWVLQVAMSFEGKEHGAAVVDDELAAQVCFFFKPFDK